MPRPSLGSAARRNARTVKTTDAEDRWLTEHYGSPARGLRALLSAAMQGQAVLRTEPPPPPPEVSVTPEMSGPHRHIRGEVVEEKWDAGTRMVRHACKTCKEVLPWRAA